MMDSWNKTSLYRDIILNTRKPLVFRKFSTNWNCFNCSLEDWCQRFDAACSKGYIPKFDRMPMKFGNLPQFERYRSKRKTTFTEFLQTHTEEKDYWEARYYEPNTQIPIECRQDMNFGCFGFPQDKTNDATFWLSSKGANTPCHYDTYGCNIVVQVFGKKHWLLFPPDTKLTAIRVPYEESSVYCSENFFSPKNLDAFSAVRNHAYECFLNEGDVLIVPRNWWHYVESMETALSVNMWVPLEIDLDAQIEECIVKYIVENTLNEEFEEVKRYILNPNQIPLIAATDELFEILNILVKQKSAKTQSDGRFPYHYLSETDVNRLIAVCQNNLTVLQPLSPDDFDSILRQRTERYIDMEQPDKCNIHPMQEALLNAICHPNVVNQIKEEFLKQTSKSV